MGKVALIFGITGQDGSYLADLLLSKNYIVHGVRRRSSSFNSYRIEHLYKNPYENKTKFYLHYGDVTDGSSIKHLISTLQPDEIYNFAAQSHVHVSFETPESSSEVNALGVLKILETIRTSKKKIKFYQASTSEMYGNSKKNYQDEDTNFSPVSPYGVSKLYSHWMINVYRESYKLYAVSGILFNHESPRRGENFVSRKITMALNNILKGNQKYLFLGNLDSKRDWGHAKDYVNGIWLMLQQKKPMDMVLATGTTKSVREFAEAAFNVVGIKLKWTGKRLNEQGIIDKINHKILNKYSNNIFKEKQILIKVNKHFYRPYELGYLKGNASLAKKILKWKTKINFNTLVREMVENDCK